VTLDAILDELLMREGGFSNDPDDRGGPTRFGITAETLGNWRGWTRPATLAEVEALTRAEAKAIYIARYIEQPGFTPANIPDEALRVALIDDGVLSGTVGAIRRLQRIVGVPVDGVLGPVTAAAVRAHDPQWIRTELVKARCLHFGHLVAHDSSQRRFLVGWLARVLSFLCFVLMAVPAQAQERPILDTALTLANGSAIVAHAADLTSTVFCLGALTCKEANPLLAPHVADPVKFFTLKMGVALGSYAIKQVTRKRYPGQTLAFAIAENVAFFWIAKRNYDIHRRAR
jgi:lysozyme family protein